MPAKRKKRIANKTPEKKEAPAEKTPEKAAEAVSERIDPITDPTRTSAEKREMIRIKTAITVALGREIDKEVRRWYIDSVRRSGRKLTCDIAFDYEFLREGPRKKLTFIIKAKLGESIVTVEIPGNDFPKDWKLLRIITEIGGGAR